MISEEVLDAILASGCSAQQIVEAVKADLRADEAKKVLRRQGNRERQRTRRTRLRAAKDRPVTSVTRDRGDTPLRTSPQESSPSAPKGASVPTEFDRWYQEYPNKVARGHAERAFVRARRLASLEELIEAVRRYAAQTDDRPWKNPATWLNGKCWLDEPPNPVASRSPPPQRRGLAQAADDLLERMREANGTGSNLQDRMLAAPVRDIPPTG